MKIDLHVHSQERSACAKGSEEQLIQAAIAAGLDSLVFTDHHCLVPAAHLAELNARHAPFRVFGGIEISLDEDVVVIGLQHPALELRDWTYPKLYDFVHQQGGFLVLAHPFRFHAEIALPVQQLPPDAIEIHSTSTPPQAEPRIRQLAVDLSIPTLCNSDAHFPDKIGLYYNILEGNPMDEVELIGLLRAGRISCRVSKGVLK